MSADMPTIQHLALHLAKDAGLLAAAAEKMDHPEEHEAGCRLFIEWMTKRRPHVERSIELLESALLALSSKSSAYGVERGADGVLRIVERLPS